MKKILTIVIEGEFPTLNQYTDAERTHRQIAAKMKAEQTLVVSYATLGVLPITEYPVKVVFHWYRLNQKSDPDNIAFAKKFILDGLQVSKVLKGDGWKQISGFEDHFYNDSNPRTVIEFIKGEAK